MLKPIKTRETSPKRKYTGTAEKKKQRNYYDGITYIHICIYFNHVNIQPWEENIPLAFPHSLPRTPQMYLVSLITVSEELCSVFLLWHIRRVEVRCVSKSIYLGVSLQMGKMGKNAA